jgi:hypothetical protein
VASVGAVRAGREPRHPPDPIALST